MGIRKTSVSDLRVGALLLSSTHFSLRAFRTPRLALLTRTSTPFQTASEIEQCINDLSRCLPSAERAGWRVLIDMRLSPIRVDPALDPAYERLRRETHAGFERVAVVVETALGRMRAERLARGSTVALAVVGSLDEAFAFLDQ
jgi:hypothetical protein